jgi:predicted nuclease with TOPRIM domain
MVLQMKETELKKLLKPINDKRLRDDLGDDGFALLQKAIKENEKLRKKVTELETRLDNLQARLLRLEEAGHL